MLAIEDLIIGFFFSIDRIVYNFISTLYDLLMGIARTSVFTQADIAQFSSRIYTLLAVFMVFKVTFSLIMYVVNPDDFSDKSKGVGKLGTNIIITLCLLILTPYIFNYAYELQTIILEDNTLIRLVMGERTKENNYINTAGDTMAYITMSAFFEPNLSIQEISSCSNLAVYDEEAEDYKFNKLCSGLNDDYQPLKNSDSGVPEGYDEANTLYALTSDNTNPKFNLTMLQNYVAGVENQNLGLMFRSELATATYEDGEDDVRIMDYKYVISVVVGVVIALLLITFCMDIALRSLKLGFLQLIAPIPIISFVDPKSGKDGLFKKWYQMCFKTYLSLFIRLLAIYFAVYIIGKVGDRKMVDLINGSYQTSKIIGVFIIIGALMFAKQLPKILEGLGIKLDGDGKFTLNPLKKFQDQALGGKQILSAGGALAAGGAAFGSNMIATKGNVLKKLGSGIAGATSSTFRGIKGTAKGEGFGKTFSNSYSGAMKARTSRDDRQADNVGWGEMMISKTQQKLGMHTAGEKVKTATETSKKIQSVYDSMMNAAIGNDTKEFTTKVNGQDMTFKGIKGLEQFITDVNKTQISREKYGDDEEGTKAYLRALEEQTKLRDSLDAIKKERLNDIASGKEETLDESTTTAIREGYKQMIDLAKDLNKVTAEVDPEIKQIKDKDTGKVEDISAKDINGMAKGISNHIIASQDAAHAQTVDQYAAKPKQS